MDGYSTKLAAHAIEVSFGSLRKWVWSDFLKPSIVSPISGEPDRFSFDDILIAKLFAILVRDLGFLRKAAAELLEGPRLYAKGIMLPFQPNKPSLQEASWLLMGLGDGSQFDLLDDSELLECFGGAQYLKQDRFVVLSLNRIRSQLKERLRG